MKTGIFLRRPRDTSPKEPSFLMCPRFVCSIRHVLLHQLWYNSNLILYQQFEESVLSNDQNVFPADSG